MTNYEKYFGTPEKAAETIDKATYACQEVNCKECVLRRCPCGELEKVVDWLQEECDG